MSMADVKLHLANEETKEQRMGKIALNNMTASVYISSCISLEDQRYFFSFKIEFKPLTYVPIAIPLG
jgi:hypothetical protein